MHTYLLVDILFFRVKEKATGKYYFVSHEALIQLLSKCKKCAGDVAVSLQRGKGGSTVFGLGKCSRCLEELNWRSSPLVRSTKIAEIDLLLTSSVLFSGSGISKSLRLLEVMNVPTVTEKTFHQHQTRYLHKVMFI